MLVALLLLVVPLVPVAEVAPTVGMLLLGEAAAVVSPASARSEGVFFPLFCLLECVRGEWVLRAVCVDVLVMRAVVLAALLCDAALAAAAFAVVARAAFGVVLAALVAFAAAVPG